MQCSTPLEEPWEHAVLFKVWLGTSGHHDALWWREAEGYSLVHPASVICLLWRAVLAGEYQMPAPGKHISRARMGLHQAQSPFSTSGKMNCSTGLYHSLFTCTPQLGGLKRAMKRASYRLGGERQEIPHQMQQVFTQLTF